MNTNIASLVRPALLSCAFIFALVALPAVQAADAPAMKPLPVTTSCAKVTGEKGPYALTLKNTSAESLKVTVAVAESVQSHSKAKVRNMPACTIEAGKTCTVDELAATDKVTVTAEGFAPLEVTVP